MSYVKEYNVSIVVEVPEVGATPQQIDEWLEYKTGYRGDMQRDNPLVDVELVTNWIETGLN